MNAPSGANGSPRAARPHSPFAPLANRAFLALWTANLLSNTGGWMATTGEAWEMTSLTPEPIFVALLSAAGTLPMFLFCFFAGILGIIGGVLIWGAARAARRNPRVAYVLLVAGAVPFAVVTWWSVVTPLIAILALVIGARVIRETPPAVTPGSALQRSPQLLVPR